MLTQTEVPIVHRFTIHDDDFHFLRFHESPAHAIFAITHCWWLLKISMSAVACAGVWVAEAVAVEAAWDDN